MIPVALTIAGSDSGGGAGIQADLKTFSALGVFGTSVLTAVTAQNTRGVTAVETLPPAIVAAQIDAVLGDFTVGGIKIGMVSSEPVIRTIAERLRAHGRRAVVDPVMIATSGDRLIDADALEALREELLPLADVLTPNLPEAALLLGTEPAASEEAMLGQGERLLALGPRAVLMKGGHREGPDSVDLLVSNSSLLRLAFPRVETNNDHGTGCTLAAAIAAGLAKGLDLESAVREARLYLQAALAAGAAWRLGSGRGPVHHFHALWPKAGQDVS
ncbi:bifunctional hydroxymethylpyrimidine kinase/phosphomethylpyrimidine kinase [Aureimonas sp. AU40]|uniref:bifunctional hydroxymethylpyrimidine kinase/phosphomethylpyrimidine kinase n=1 Tax=Aureimonas sp. AU40 TaxID=1637747 RepID=UPI000782ED16|nr:bifunctional hydroxymethylpyrimidine kinase/phosphomethylpyrimidine kinase [Aureimonas sp. AU40]